MIGTILNIDQNFLELQLSFDVTKSRNIIGSFLLIRDVDNQFIGEVDRIVGAHAFVRIIGEYRNGSFLYGTIKRPSFKAEVYLVAREFIPVILGQNSHQNLTLGTSTLYDIPLKVDVDSLFGGHFAILARLVRGNRVGYPESYKTYLR